MKTSRTSFEGPEAATRGVLCKKVFLEISQNSLVSKSLCSPQASVADSGTGVFLGILWNF